MKKKSIPDVYLFFYFLTFIIGGIVLLNVPKGDYELFINRHHFLLADLFFSFITHAGDGLIFLAVFPILLYYRFAHGILCVFNAAIHMVLSVILKRLVFVHSPRPAEFFKDIDLVQVAGVPMHHWHSFPSGHTATAFALMTMLAMLYPKRHRLQLGFLLVAVLIGFSRVYLMQHFILDVMAGSVLGVGSAFAARTIVRTYFKGKTYKKGLLKKKKVALSELKPGYQPLRIRIKPWKWPF
ncbi:phosphatase PAP2 family protein [Echinicola vietnamensis]|uniref:Membrane-associated phospholipid phosphatase n=1 Tax=Echinicola vietnamensis (strain DSM 17526 / LMG 23754 / KMM 6221) TaxID=926556 RepID=L0FUY4_ECHVK|nr:phosphatase PAP2 family protein [Echinicola vietnamensis]AGA77102.1 membrane-associated phospholipid phosphatase [Echinicola vietnamensis DSM 17526]